MVATLAVIPLVLQAVGGGGGEGNDKKRKQNKFAYFAFHLLKEVTERLLMTIMKWRHIIFFQLLQRIKNNWHLFVHRETIYFKAYMGYITIGERSKNGSEML